MMFSSCVTLVSSVDRLLAFLKKISWNGALPHCHESSVLCAVEDSFSWSELITYLGLWLAL